MSDFSSGVVVDDDLDFSAVANRTAGREAVGSRAAAWGGKGLTVAIGVSAAVMVAGIVLWFLQLSGGFSRDPCGSSARALPERESGA